MSAVQAVNLLSPIRRAARRRRKHVARWVVGLAVYGAVLLAVWGMVHLVGSDADRAVAAELARVRDEIDRSKQVMRDLQPVLAEVRTTLAAGRAVGNQPDWSLLLGLLSNLLDEQAVLTGFHLEPVGGGGRRLVDQRNPGQADAEQAARGPYRLHLTGFGESQAVVQRYVLRLEETGLFETVTLLDAHAALFRGHEAVRFRIECRLGVPPERRSEAGSANGLSPAEGSQAGTQTVGREPGASDGIAAAVDDEINAAAGEPSGLTWPPLESGGF